MRATLFLVGVALVIVCLVGWNDGATSWLLSLDALCALLACLALALPDELPSVIRGAPLSLAVLLDGGAALALHRGATSWLILVQMLFAAGLMAAWALLPAPDAGRAPLAFQKQRRGGFNVPETARWR